MRLLPSATSLALVLSVTFARGAHAQHEGHAGMAMDTNAASTAPRHWHLMAQAIPVVTRAAHTVGGEQRTEAFLAQTAAMGRADLLGGHLRLEGTLNGEGLTMRHGELSTGAFGEGYVDRRHPHTYLHELIASGIGTLGPFAYSASVGRGFAPFGTDDPMMRPFEKYPINHHLSQILERGLIAGALRLGPAIVEGSTFGGEEPTSPSSTPRLRRIGDSWSLRGTALPLPGVELQASYARVKSPEQAEGFGLNQRKRSVSARFVSPKGDRYLMAEWARTVESDPNRGDDVFGYETALAEGALAVRAFDVALRLEQTERPEEERLADPFRTPRPAPDLAITGITRWRAATLAVVMPAATFGPIRGYPFVELERLAVAPRAATNIFDPERFYGSASPWMASVGMRLRFGSPHGRMGRYGAALPAGAPIHALGSGTTEPSMHDRH